MSPRKKLDTSNATILRRPQVSQKTGLGRSTIYLKVAEGTFPKPIVLSARAVGWIASEVDQWVAGKIAASRGTGAPRLAEAGDDRVAAR